MWRKLVIRNEIFFVHCFMNFSSSFTCILYGLSDCWCETVSQKEVQERIKLLNRRMRYNEYVKNTLLSGNIEHAILEELPRADARNTYTRILKLKYRIEECLFQYEWHVTKQSSKEFQQNFITPLLLTLDCLGQQVDVLKEILRKKDEELKQYYREGLTLQRKTLTTKPFNFDEFEKTFSVSRRLQNFNDLAKMVVAANSSHNSSKPKVDASIVHQSRGKSKSLKKRKRLIEQMKIENRKYILKKNKGALYESQSTQITTETDNQEDYTLVHNSYNATIENVKQNLYITTEESECKMASSNEIINVVKDEMHTKCINLQSFDEMQSNEGNVNDVIKKKETTLEGLSLEQNKPDLQNICHQLEIIKKELKELENLRLADLRKRKN